MITATYVNATTFTVSGDQTAEFHVGRRVKHVGDTTGYGTIESVSVPVADTQVVLTAASDNLDASLSGVYYGIVGSYEPESSIPIHTHDGDEGSGGNIFAAPTFTGQATIPTINLTGGQIAFPATAVPSADPNTLDDYEEGSFTPEVNFSGDGVGVTYDSRSGSYTKIGKYVFVNIAIDLSSKGSSVGDLRIGALPFTVGVSAAATIGIFQNTTFADVVLGWGVQANTYIALDETTGAGARTTITNGNATDNSQFYISLSYNI